MLAIDTGYGFGSDPSALAASPEMIIAEAARVQRNAIYIGIGLGLVGALVGGATGRWAGRGRPLATIGGVVGGGLGLGLGSFYVSRKAMSANATQRLAYDW